MCKKISETLKLIEKLSFIKISDYSATERRLQQSIELAKKLEEVDVSEVKPLYTVLEGFNLQLRKDQSITYKKEEIFGNAQRVDYGYFVLDLPKDTKN